MEGLINRRGVPRLLVPAAGAREFFTRPVGRYFAGRSFVAWCKAPNLWGHTFWGNVQYEDLAPTVELMTRLGPSVPFDLVSDFSRIERISGSVFELSRRHLVDHFERHQRLLDRHAVVLARGFAGSVVAGFYSAVGVAVPWSFECFRTLDEAFQWLKAPGGAAIMDEVERIVGGHWAVPAVVSALRPLLEARVGRETIAIGHAASALGVSVRTLQRRLKDAGTTFGAELDRARVEMATDLLADRSMKITAVARSAGFASAAHLARVFRRTRGESPAVCRARSV